ncbi:tetratricopeptide repeat protein [Longispora albida]|uniref:tetratricopeptide repeat protein n=1 Tax=Longispora albida TaxID=203523 RepID=UPI000380938F|nr:sel1 repeat family protein [Longispora albida]
MAISGDDQRRLPVVVDPKLAVLPFGDLSWEGFECLARSTIEVAEGMTVSRLYGTPGQRQKGIDAFAQDSSGEWHVFQFRRVKRFTVSDLRKILDPFVAGSRPFGAKRLAVVTSLPRISAKVQDAIYEYQLAHPDFVIDQIWDAHTLGSKLRRHPDIVAQSFGRAVAERFCDDDVLVEARPRPGRPIAEFQDPLALEVHAAIQPVALAPSAPQLPTYVPRQHDGELGKVVDRAIEGIGGIGVLLGNSSTGKTRSAWEQVQRLPEDWWLWHPASPDELLAGLPAIAPNTVLWLNELQRYLCTDDVHRDEKIAGLLIGALRDGRCAPVLILGTLWHEYRLKLAPAETEGDIRPQCRALVTERFILVPETFTPAELDLLERAADGDQRLAEARAQAEEGHITQYLGGGPAQIERYKTAPPAARAVLHAAMDARRLGWQQALPAGFLMDAAQAYMTSLERDHLPGDWFEAAAEYLLPLCRGARGPLSRIRPGTAAESRVTYRLADYLEQHAKRARARICPPDIFWLASLRTDVESGDLSRLAQAAYARSRIDIAHQLAREAAARGEAAGVSAFATQIDNAENREAAMPYFRLAADNGDSWSQTILGVWHEDEGEWDLAEAWYSKADNGREPYPMVGLASVRAHHGDLEEADRLYEKALKAGGARAVEYQARHLAAEGQHDAALHLATRSFQCGNREALTGLAWTYGPEEHDRALSVMEHAAKLGFTKALFELIMLSTTYGDADQTLAYCERAAQAGQPQALRVAASFYAGRGDERQAAALLWRASNAGSAPAMMELAQLREKQGRGRARRKIYERVVQQGEAFGLVKLAGIRERAGDSGMAEQLAARYERLSSLAPGNAAWCEIARVREGRGDIAGAEALLWRIAEAGDLQILTKIAELRVRCGDHAGAVQVLRTAVDCGVAGARQALLKLDTGASEAATAGGHQS